MFRNIIQSLFAKGMVAVMNFAILILTSHYLGVSSRGEIAVLILNISIIQIVNEIFTGYTLVYFIPKYNLRRIFVAGILYTIIACSVTNSVFYFLGEHIKNHELLSYIISFIVILNTFNCVIILGKEKIAAYNFLNVLQPLLLLFGVIYMTYWKRVYTLEAYVWPLLVSFVIAFIISSSVALKLVAKKETPKPFLMKPVLINGLLCQLAVLMHVFCNRYSYYLLETTAEVGLYSSASSLIESVLIISNGIAPVLLSRVANAGDSEQSKRITLSLAKVSFILSGFCVMIIALIPNSFFVFLLGTGFENAKAIMMMYSPGILMLSFAGIISHYFSATGKLKIILVCNGIGFAVAMALAHLLIRKYSYTGAAISADVSYSALTVSLCVAFFLVNKIKAKELFSLKEDYINLKNLFFSRHSG
ncbi:MAG: polysaccharide biosynthesis C-terminal domain-containing protein [Bacteroidetes bacterium]|nr:polysaccharide biosynthesis C-terminal domain-containing protein [Bacteroidota bacterium]